MRHYLAFDLGAESGRAMLGTLDDGRLAVEELHRFANTPVRVFDALYWDTLRLWHEIQRGLAIAGRERKLQLDGIGIDTWGVDFALLGADGALADNPRHYRDARTNGVMEKVFSVVPRAEVFAQTGIQFMQINSLYQFYALKLAGSPALKAAHTLLFMPDLLNYWLTGVARAELTIASTSQFYDPRKKTWARDLLERLGLPSGILPEIVAPGTRLGPLLDSVAEAAGLGAVPVYATGCHDTASAVAAVPAEGTNWCYISSGTWSLMGAELDEPVINERVLAENLTNEIGAAGKVRFLKNIAGPWLLQECRRAWGLEGADRAGDQRAGAGGESDQRNRRGGEGAVPEKHRGTLAAAGVPARVGAGGGRIHLRGTGAAGGRGGAGAVEDRSGRVPGAGRDAAQDRGALPGAGPRASGDAGRVHAHDSGELGGAVSAGAGESGGAGGAAGRRDPYCWRRVAECAAEPVGGGCHEADGDCGAERGDGDWECADPGDWGGGVGGAGGGAGGGAAAVWGKGLWAWRGLGLEAGGFAAVVRDWAGLCIRGRGSGCL